MDIVERQIQRTRASEIKRVLQMYPQKEAEKIIRLILLGFSMEGAINAWR